MSKLFFPSALMLITFVPIQTYADTAYARGGGDAATANGPTITGVANNYSYIPSGFPNSGIAPGSIFLIFGSGMSSASTGNVGLQSSASPGIPTMLAGASLSVTVGATTVTPAMYYATPTQIAAVLPSSTPTGSAMITVTYEGTTSNAFSFQVVPYALGFDTYYGIGSGLVAATNPATGALYTYTNSATPSETIVLWGSGLGADTADSDTVFTTAPHAVSTPLQIYFGGVPAARILYAGSSGYPGLDQFDVTLPDNAPTDCLVSVVAVAGTGSSATMSNFGVLPISPSGGECTSSIYGIPGSTLSSLNSLPSVAYAYALVSQTIEPAAPPATGTVTSNFVYVSFEKQTGAVYGFANGTPYSPGSCSVSDTVSGQTSTLPTGLAAGTVTLTGAAGTYPLPAFATGIYENFLPTNAITSSGGAFTFTGSGSADVGFFTSTVNLPNPLLQWTNQSAGATINRAQGLTVNWTGGATGTYVFITGYSTDPNTKNTGSFTCITDQSTFTYVVPDYVTRDLPAGSGKLTVENEGGYTPISATGLNSGFSYFSTGVEINSTYQ